MIASRHAPPTGDALAEANSLLAAADLHSADCRWLRGSAVDILITPLPCCEGDKEQRTLVTLAVRGRPAASFENTVVSVEDACARRSEWILNSMAQVQVTLPEGPFRLSLEPPASPLRTDPRRRSRGTLAALASAAGAAAAMVTALVVLAANTPAVATVDLTPANCSNTAGRSGDDKLVVAAVWAGEERKRFSRVLEDFEKRWDDQVTFATDTPERPVRDLGATLRQFIDQSCPPDVALVPQPGLLRDLAAQGHLIPLDDIAGDLIRTNYSTAWQDQAKVDGKTYGVWFKAAHKSLLWYNTAAFAKAGITEPPKTWEELKDAARRLRAVGITPFSIAGGDGWTLTDWFENVYLRMWGADQYARLSSHAIPWTDSTVTRALSKLAELFSVPDWFVDGASGAQTVSYEESVADVFPRKGEPKAAMVFEGGFVSNEIAKSGARVGTDAKFFEFPSIAREGDVTSAAAGVATPVVGVGSRSNGGDAVGGDVAVMLRDTPAARRFLRYLATPDAARPWVRVGGFTSPNTGVRPEEYPDAASGEVAASLLVADRVNFDLSDVQSSSFGSDPRSGAWPIFQRFLRDPDQTEEIARQLEQAWDEAHR